MLWEGPGRTVLECATLPGRGCVFKAGVPRLAGLPPSTALPWRSIKKELEASWIAAHYGPKIAGSGSRRGSREPVPLFPLIGGCQTQRVSFLWLFGLLRYSSWNAGISVVQTGKAARKSEIDTIWHGVQVGNNIGPSS